MRISTVKKNVRVEWQVRDTQNHCVQSRGGRPGEWLAKGCQSRFNCRCWVPSGVVLVTVSLTGGRLRTTVFVWHGHLSYTVLWVHAGRRRWIPRANPMVGLASPPGYRLRGGASSCHLHSSPHQTARAPQHLPLSLFTFVSYLETVALCRFFFSIKYTFLL